jgi:hypothetical protein
MRRLLKYAFVLALAVAIGAYIVLEPVSLEDIVLSHPEQKAAAAHLQPTPPASPASIDEELDSASTDKEQGYGVAAQWLEWLASYPQSATVKVVHLLFADAPDNAEVSTDESARTRAQGAADEGVLLLRRLRLVGRDGPVSPEEPKVKLLRPTHPYVWTPPAQAQGAGFTNLAFNSDFSTGLNVSNSGTWYNPGIWFQSAATGSLTPTDSGGVLNLSWSPGDSAAGVTVGTMSPTGKSNTSWQYGYIEVSAAFPPVTGEWPAIWLQSNTATTSYVPKAGAHSYSEVDIFAWQSQIPTTFNGHIHTWVAAAGAQVSDAQNNDTNSTASFPNGTNLGNFNTYGVLWTSSQVSWYFNNTLLFSATASQYPQAFSVLNAGPMYLMLSNQAGANWQVGNSDPTSTADMKVEWVHVWGH